MHQTMILQYKSTTLLTFLRKPHGLPYNPKTFNTVSDMEDVYSNDVLQQTLVNSSMRGDGLMSELQAAKQQIQDLTCHVTVYKSRYQEVSEALEVEEAKTDAERFARQEAEKTTRQHRAEVLKSRRNEVIANEHCERAESEYSRLESLLASERSLRVATDRLVARLREDLSLAETNETSVYNQLNGAKAQVSSLQEDLEIAEHRMAMLKLDGREIKDVLQKEHQRFMETAEALNIAEEEAKCAEDRFSDLLKKYNALKAFVIESDTVSSMTTTASDTTAFDTGSVVVDVQSPTDHGYGDPLSPKYIHEQVTEIYKAMDKKTIVEITSSKAKGRPFDPTGMPAFPEPVIVRPAHASLTSSLKELLEANARSCSVPSATTKNLRWKFCCRVPTNFLQGVFSSIC